ncbi:MAG: SAM-dependent methyltransferase [Micromonosporaceae bacterium]|nr:SAM-dependent methyltransferase [Micromonosporaceae bacterium]
MGSQLGAFLREFARNPQRTGALAPSSPELAREAVLPIPSSGDPVVVELGPGTGSFTGAIQDRLSGRGHHVAVELNPRFAELLQVNFPAVDVATDDATHLASLLADRSIERADVIISGLPWAIFPDEVQTGLMDAVTASLCPAGAFTSFAYLHALRLPPARRFRALLRETFEEVVVGRTVWQNLPPARVYFARRPRQRSVDGLRPASSQ